MTSAETTSATGYSGPASCYAEARLRLLHEQARSGPPRRTELARITDRWLAGLLASGTHGVPAGVSLVAVGGYGRGELSPRSDLDLLLLHDGTLDPARLAALADRLWYPIWDLGLDLDHSVRTPAQARKTAEGDLRAHLGLLDARHLAGSAELTAGLRSAVLADWRNRAPTRLPELRELCRERARRHGELRFLLEPDLKEARGGLRDLTALRAVAASWLADAPRHGLAEARTRLLDVRDALHLTTGRATDRLVLQDQDQVSHHLGVLDADVLLRQVYEAARTVAHADDLTWREVGRVLRARSGRPRLRGLRGTLTGGGRAPAESARSPLAEGVVEQDGEAGLARTARPERDPVLPLRAAAAAAQAGLPLSLAAVQRMAGAGGCRPLPDPWPSEAREQLVTLLGAGEATVPVWETLEAGGLITRLLPDWERVRCRPQRNPVHRWTVDRHLVETAVRASELTRRVGRPDLLLVAALLHDIGKGWPGDHSVVGETIARDMAERIGFSSRDASVLGTLVRHHLLLVETATRRDLDDPATVQTVAGAVGDVGTLEILHALTEADARATGPGAWGSWRATLVGDLVGRVRAVLDGVPHEPPAGDAADVAHERLAHEALSTGVPVLVLQTDPHPPEGADAHHDAGRAAGEPVGVELVIAVPDREGVLPAAAGVLALHRLRVRTADLRVLTLPHAAGSQGPGARAAQRDALLLTWRVSAVYGSLPEAVRLRKDLERALDGSLDVPGRLAEREAAHPVRRGIVAPPPRVTVAPAGSRFATVIEVRAQDVPGLLHRVGLALEAAGARVRSAHVSTLGANAVDAFYVTDAAGAPLPDEEAAALARTVERAVRA
ncbi:[protein-PII] uridylyltransferase [Streptomyces meridianus]|uniref:Bifunctional uridylyltransferase/uridylyl-removing enzyme n=1 Tax=Streptomyces meridianus TaxID=2938945 RepID=A0ABT0X4B1_9ACTN|nr:[protein-PII] uridylyltransferase [Streptomyces meridianus]MCM2576634.1 [protein-PII] uridylyltransferase [Streptomyces meridianus]